jgi:hypothetical protein
MMDNFRSHKTQKVQAVVTQFKAKILFNIPSLAIVNPATHFCAHIKGKIVIDALSTREVVIQKIRKAISMILGYQ